MKSVRAILRKEVPISRRVVVSIEDADEAEDFEVTNKRIQEWRVL